MRASAWSLAALITGALLNGCGGSKANDAGGATHTTGGSNGRGGETSAGGSGSGGAPGSPDGPPASGTTASEDFVARYVPALCRQFVCQGLTPDIEACRNDFFNPSPDWIGLYLVEIVQAIDTGRILYDRDHAGPCYDATLGAGCASSSQASASEACALAFRGNVPTGGACVTAIECADRACHKPSCGGACCLGTCGQPFAAGTACNSSDDCAEGLYCGYGSSSAQRTCRPHEGVGQACDSSSFCQSGLTCDQTGSHTCVPPLKEGDPCTPDGLECGLTFCDRTTGTCRPRRPVGAACTTPDAAAYTRFDAGCVYWAACIDGTCTALPGIGATCSIPAGGRVDQACRLGSCINGTCQTSATPTSPCTVTSARTPDAGARD